MNVLGNLERRLADMLAKDAQRRTTARALDVAINRFKNLHALWYEALFDEAFVRRVFAAEGGRVDATTLAREWSRQFRYRDARQRERDIRQLEPVAESFLRLFAQANAEIDPEGNPPRRRQPIGQAGRMLRA